MYLVNYLSLQTAQQLFIAADRFRTGVGLIGPKDGINVSFHTPGFEKFSQNLPFLSISLYFNGIRQALLDDYVVVESAGVGTGFDTIIMERPLRTGDHLLADYVIK